MVHGCRKPERGFLGHYSGMKAALFLGYYPRCSDLNNSIPNNSESTQINSWHSIRALGNSILEQN